MREDNERMLLELFLELDDELIGNRICSREKNESLSEVKEKLKVLSALSSESSIVRRYREQEDELEKQLRKLQSEESDLLDALNIIRCEIKPLQLVVIKLGKSSLDRQRIIDAWRKFCAGGEIGESESVGAFFECLPESTTDEDIGNEFDRLKNEGWW